jgi:peptidoglycan/xylan/chitin deacetylase (PgdA/CDA1 family)
MRILRKIAIFFVISAVALCAFYIFYMQPRYAVPVLMYHSISEDESSTLSVKPENFKKQIEYLSNAGYSVISLDELVDGISQGKKFSHKEVVLTFDDGLVDNYINAFPVLSKYDLPAIIFLETDNIGQVPGYLTWDQVRLMAKNNLEFGAHTKTGAYLPSIDSDKELIDEIAGSKSDMEKELARQVIYFCYPTGGFNNTVKELVRQSGYKGACTTNRGFDMRNKDVYEINRIKVTDSDINKPLNFRAKLSGYYNIFRKGKSPD